MGKSKTESMFEALNKKLSVSRRGFIKGAAAIGAAATLGGCSKGSMDSAASTAPGSFANDLRAVRKVYSTCPVECLTHSLNCQLVGDEVVRVEPTTKPSDYCYTTACARGLSRMQFLTENRVATPMKRIKKGSAVSPLGVVLKNNDIDQWVSISWDQAISEIGAKLKELKDSGDKGIMSVTGSGNMGPIANTIVGQFFNHINSSRATKVGSPCCQSVTDGMTAVLGVRSIDTRDTVRDSKCIVNWGNNPAVTTSAYWKFFIEAKIAGAKMITIDPRFSDSAEKSDQWIALRPGTDALFAIGVLRYIFANDKTAVSGGTDTWIDEEFLKHRTNAPYLIDVTPILDGSVFKNKAYNELYKLTYKLDGDGKRLVRSGGATVAAEKNMGRNAIPTQDPDLYYVDLATDKVITAYELMRALYAGDLLAAATPAMDPEVVKLHDPYYDYAKIVEVTGISAISVIEEFSSAYAGSGKKSMIIQNMGGSQRTENGTNLCALQTLLPMITGNIGDRGNGIDDTSGWSSLTGYQSTDGDHMGSSIRFSVKPAAGVTHNIPFSLLGVKARDANNGTPQDIYLPNTTYPAGTKDPAIKFWYIATSNLMTQSPNVDAYRAALASSEMVVVAKPTWNTDAEYADYYLPVTTPFEYEDLGAANRNKYVSLMEAGVKPFGQSKSDGQIMRALAKVVFPDKPEIISDFDHDDSWYVNEIITNPSNNFTANGIPDYDTLKRLKSVRPSSISVPWVPFHLHEFNEGKTVDGRAKLFITEWGDITKYAYPHISRNPAKNFFLGPIPRYVPAMESKLELLPDFSTGLPAEYQQYRDNYSLACVQFKVSRTVHASFTGLSWIREAFGEKGIVWMNTTDALARDIVNGETVTVRSHIGSLERVAHVTELIMKGVVAIENGWWDKFGPVSSSNVAAELPDPMGCGHTHNNTLVEVVKGGLK